jgi:transposase InsO family protein
MTFYHRQTLRATGLTFGGQVKLLDREIFVTLEEARVLIEQWRREYNQVRPHSALRYQPPAPVAILTLVTS